jgi:hypothetical protein
MNRLSLVPLALAAALVAAAPARPALAGTTGTTYYTCTVNVSASTNTCTDGKITVTSSSGTQRVLRADLSTNSPNYVRLDALVDVCSPTGFWAHFADSPTCNAYGGDSGTAQHDAEAYIQARRFDAYGMDPTSQPIMSSQEVVPASGCYRVQWTIYEDHVLFDDDGDTADAPRLEVWSTRSFESAPYGESDSEDPSGADANRWYIGLNRTVGSASRSGTGVTKACFVLSTTTSPSPATLSSLCPTGGSGGGGGGKGQIPVDPV